jgi:hypothetical protein
VITALEIENFKAFGERQRIEIRPLTMLFGPNSGGKSSVMHAMHYLREVFVRGVIDVYHPQSAGESVDLGGVGNLVHGRVTDRRIRLKVEFNLEGAELPTYPFYGDEEEVQERANEIETVTGTIKTASVEIEIDPARGGAMRTYTVGLNGEHFAEFSMPQDRPHAEVRKINWRHPCLLTDDSERKHSESLRELDEKISEAEREATTDRTSQYLKELLFKKELFIAAQPGLLASMYQQVPWMPLDSVSIAVPSPIGRIPDFAARIAVPDMGGSSTDIAAFESLLSTLLWGPGEVLRKRLAEFRHVGPLREVPSRQSEVQDRSGQTKWANGLRAWQILTFEEMQMNTRVAGRRSLVEEVSSWLEDQERLDTGYRLERRRFKQLAADEAALLIDPDYSDRTEMLAEKIRDLPELLQIWLRDVNRNLQVLPKDLGVGLSQVIPVLVALLEPRSSLVALEQPELHLHPKQQAAMGDALIYGLASTRNRVLIVETHSEHLILRLLRRIRETTRQQALSSTMLSPEKLRIQYIRRDDAMSRVEVIDVDVNGDLVDPWPDDFFEQDFKERFS